MRPVPRGTTLGQCHLCREGRTLDPILGGPYSGRCHIDLGTMPWSPALLLVFHVWLQTSFWGWTVRCRQAGTTYSNLNWLDCSFNIPKTCKLWGMILWLKFSYLGFYDVFTKHQVFFFFPVCSFWNIITVARNQICTISLSVGLKMQISDSFEVLNQHSAFNIS